MIKCPKCGKELPEGTRFCLDCFSSLDEKAEAAPEAVKKEKKAGKALLFLKSKQFVTALSCVLVVALAFTGAALLKKNSKNTIAVAPGDTTFIPVTDANGETVTDESGEAVTQIAVPVTDKSGETVTDANGNKVLQAVVPVTNASGENVTNKSGEQVFEIISTLPSPSSPQAANDKSTSNSVPGNGDKTSTGNSATSGSQKSDESSTSADTDKPSFTRPGSQPETKPTTQPDTQPTSPPTQPDTQPSTEPTTSEPVNTSDFSYKIINGKILITSYNGNAKNVVVPTHIDGKEVTYIGAGAFKDNSNIQKISFASITSGYGRSLFFQEGAVFDNLPNLTEIKLAWETYPQLVNSDCSSARGISDTASGSRFNALFQNVPSLQKITQDSIDVNPDNYNYGNVQLRAVDNCLVSGNYFLYCPASYPYSSLTIPNEIKYVANNAFKECRTVKTVIIGSNMQNIGWLSFLNAVSIEEFTVSSDNPTYFSHDGILFSGSNSQYNLICYPPAKKDSSYTFPSQYSTLKFYLSAFCKNPYIKTLVLPKCNVIEALAISSSYRPTNLSLIKVPSDDENLNANLKILQKYYTVELY